PSEEKNQPRLIRSRVAFARLTVDIFADRRTIAALKSAMMPESVEGKKCKLALRKGKNGGKLALVFSSKDLVSLRAGLNTNLRLAASALKSIRIAKQIRVIH
ncbi:MAG: hypothetical protein ACRDF4_04945, partial [Rhabdochlamydiaceae bacterium]